MFYANSQRELSFSEQKGVFKNVILGKLIYKWMEWSQGTFDMFKSTLPAFQFVLS